MKIIWHGHACFTLCTEQGSVTIDPFTDNYVPGCGVIRPVSDAVFCSHGHGDHSGAEVVTLTGKSCEVGVETIPTWHDEVQGAKRGSNLIHIFSAEGMKVIHLGDLGCEPEQAQMDAMSAPDVLMIPVGGFYTIDAAEASRLVERLSPRIVIPMHYKGDGFGFDPIATVDDFLSLCKGTIKVLDSNTFEVTPDTPSMTIVPRLIPNL